MLSDFFAQMQPHVVGFQDFVICIYLFCEFGAIKSCQEFDYNGHAAMFVF